MRSIIGLDHIVVMTHDLAASAARWQHLGFTVSPEGRHSAIMGTANHTIMFQDDYLELIGVLGETERNANGRAFLARRGEGIDRAAFTGTDVDAGVAELKARGIVAVGPHDFGRPVPLPGGRQAEARFRVFRWPLDVRPGDLGIFTCQHLTREHVWVPELMRHANTAQRVNRLEILARDPAAAAQEMGHLYGQAPETLPDGAIRLATGAGRGDFVFLDRHSLEKRHPGVPLKALPPEGAVALVIGVESLSAAANAAGAQAAVTTAERVEVAPKSANGVIVTFEAA